MLLTFGEIRQKIVMSSSIASIKLPLQNQTVALNHFLFITLHQFIWPRNSELREEKEKAKLSTRHLMTFECRFIAQCSRLDEKIHLNIVDSFELYFSVLPLWLHLMFDLSFCYSRHKKTSLSNRESQLANIFIPMSHSDSTFMSNIMYKSPITAEFAALHVLFGICLLYNHNVTENCQRWTWFYFKFGTSDPEGHFKMPFYPRFWSLDQMLSLNLIKFVYCFKNQVNLEWY